ncbi:MAG: hypothetical protein L6Q97_08285 [Thermoanaerobaculia bacterium]|nr:hypothetical protein [Thermoanaerobaculia bacterium]
MIMPAVCLRRWYGLLIAGFFRTNATPSVANAQENRPLAQEKRPTKQAKPDYFAEMLYFAGYTAL